jgi:hypothetical protein
VGMAAAAALASAESAQFVKQPCTGLVAGPQRLAQVRQVQQPGCERLERCRAGSRDPPAALTRCPQPTLSHRPRTPDIPKPGHPTPRTTRPSITHSHTDFDEPLAPKVASHLRPGRGATPSQPPPLWTGRPHTAKTRDLKAGESPAATAGVCGSLGLRFPGLPSVVILASFVLPQAQGESMPGM